MKYAKGDKNTSWRCRPHPKLAVEIMYDDDSNKETEEGLITKLEIKNAKNDDVDTRVDTLHHSYLKENVWK